MENKGKFWKGVLVGALVTAFVCLCSVGMAAGINLIVRSNSGNLTKSPAIEAESGGEHAKLNTAGIIEKIDVLQQVVDKYYLFDEDVTDVEDGIYSGMMYGLGDPYSVYYNAEDFKKLMEQTEGVYHGIGVMISQDRLTGIITIVRVFQGAPGFEAGLQPGDIIYKVSGEEVTGMDLDLLVNNYIKGAEGTSVDITVLRPELNDYVDFKVARRQVEVPTVEHEMLEDNIGYIQVIQFDVVTADQFKSAVDDLQSKGMERLVVDLRGNPGGVLDSVVGMLDYILPDGLLVYTQDKNGKGEKYYSKDGHQLDLPMVVLVNENSASASEVFAGAVKDFKWGTLVGTKTFGKGIVQHLIPLGDGTAVKLTVSHYFTPSGFDLHEKGIEPDVTEELKEELKVKAVIPKEEDNQLQKGLEVLKGLPLK